MGWLIDIQKLQAHWGIITSSISLSLVTHMFNVWFENSTCLINTWYHQKTHNNSQVCWLCDSAGRVVYCDPDNINVILGHPKNMEDACKHLTWTGTLINMRDWLSPIVTANWLRPATTIEKKSLYVAAQYSFGSISSLIMPSQM